MSKSSIAQCKACQHEKRAEIDCAIVGGQTFRSVSERFKLSETGLKRHKAHIPSSLVVAPDAKEVARASTVLEHVQDLLNEAHRLKNVAETKGDIRTAMAGLRELVRIVELLAKLTGELNQNSETNVVHVHVAPETATKIAEMYLSRRVKPALPETIDV